MNKIIALGGSAAIIAVIAYFNWPTADDPELNAFAQCLAARGATMYGADWCPHCQEEKAAFDDAFQFIPYVECPDEPKRCLAAGVENYPTWIFPDGRKLVGRQGLERLAEISGCPIPQP